MRLGLLACVMSLVACSDDSTTPSKGGGSSSSSSSSGTSTPIDSGAACDTALLHTGLVAQQTGVSVDIFDCPILEWTAKNSEPDPMIFKALIYVESRFDTTSAGCPNKPCGQPAGWTDEETGCYGLMQIVPACTSPIQTPGLLPNGHPNLSKDSAAAAFSGSVFNAEINIRIGIAGIAGNRAEVVSLFPGCTPEQYTMMAVGNIASHGSTKSCTVWNTDYTKLVLDAYAKYSEAAKYPAKKY